MSDGTEGRPGRRGRDFQDQNVRKSPSVPPDDGLWLDDHQGVHAAGPKTIEQNPKGSVQPRQPDARSSVTSKNFEFSGVTSLMPIPMYP